MLVHALDHGFHPPEIWIPPAPRHVVSVADRISKARLLAAKFTHHCHCRLPPDRKFRITWVNVTRDCSRREAICRIAPPAMQRSHTRSLLHKIVWKIGRAGYIVALPSGTEKALEIRLLRTSRRKTLKMGHLRAISKRWQIVIFTAAICLTCPSGRAQKFHGSLRGIVQDASQARIPLANIVLRVAESSVEVHTASDQQGEFRVDNLVPGTYQLVVNAKGFAEARSDVSVLVSSVRDITITLQPGAVQQTVNVQGQASSVTTEPIDLASAVHQGVVTQQDLQTIPLAARSFANIAYLVPGTEPVEPSDPTKARITAVSTGGSSGLNNELSVDGGDNSDDYIGGFLQNFSPDSIQEFAVRTSQEDADTGGTTAGSLMLTTKSGTNQWHGAAAIYERAAALNARFPIENPAPNPKQPFSRQNYVGTVGGPIVEDTLWFFTAFEAVHEDASIAYSPASLPQFDALATLASEG